MSDKGIVKVEGVKCDNCSFELRDLLPIEYADLVDRPCPHCGTVLLTESDYNLYKLLLTANTMAHEIQEEESELPTEIGKIYTPQSKS